MSVTATFEPGRVASEPGVAAALTLRLHNDASTIEVVTLRAAGELADHTVVQSDTVSLDPNETFDVPIIIDVGLALPAGPHNSSIEVLAADGSPAMAEATIEVLEASGWVLTMDPEHSRSATAGKHKVRIHNTGNTPVAVELTPRPTDDDVAIELAASDVTVYPGDNALVDLRVIPPNRFWSGPLQIREFVLHAISSDGTTHQLPGTFEQGPRLRPWLLPALIGAGIALLLGTLLWFTLLKPYVDQTAEDAATLGIFEDREALRERITELELAAAEAKELPLGVPADIRLAVTAPPGSTANETFAVSDNRVLSVTDVVFQNPSGAVGRVTLLRGDGVLLESELANFRDLDFHFVAPFRFEGPTTIELRVECTAPGPNEVDCPVAATIIGFVDEAR